MLNNKKTELVSVYIVTYNRLEQLKNAISSVLRQTYENIEIIVVDDGSTDGTRQYMDLMAGKQPRVTYICLNVNMGANAARNKAILNAKGTYITGLDDDDLMHPKRVEVLIENYEESLAFVSSRYFVTKNRKISKKILTLKQSVDLNDLLYSNVVGNQVLTTKEKFMQAGLFDENLVAGQDMDMWIRLLENTPKAFIVKNFLQIVQVGAHSSITGSSKGLKGYSQVYLKHKSKMSRSQRRYQLVGLLLLRNKSIISICKIMPKHNKYAVYSMLKILKYKTINLVNKNLNQLHQDID